MSLEGSLLWLFKLLCIFLPWTPVTSHIYILGERQAGIQGDLDVPRTSLTFATVQSGFAAPQMRSRRHLKIAWPPFLHIKSFLSPPFTGESSPLPPSLPLYPFTLIFLFPSPLTNLSLLPIISCLSVSACCPRLVLIFCRMSSPLLVTESEVIRSTEWNGWSSTFSWLFNSIGCSLVGGRCVWMRETRVAFSCK